MSSLLAEHRWEAGHLCVYSASLGHVNKHGNGHVQDVHKRRSWACMCSFMAPDAAVDVMQQT